MTKSLSQVVEELKDVINPNELMDIFQALRIIKRETGWGSLEIKFLNGDLDTIEIKITRKPKKKAIS